MQIADFADIFTGRFISEIPLALSAICDALKDKTSLVEINLSDNAFGGRSVDPMVPFLTHNRSFQVLKLNNNGLGPAGGATIANALLESAKLSKAEGKSSNLRTVICGRNRLEDGSASAWAEAFAAHGSLVEVRLPQNGIRMDGIASLARGLAQCPQLEHLDLQDNTFSRFGSQAMAKALVAWQGLRVLNLSDCVLADEGEGVSPMIEAIAEGFNPKLHTLQLQNNNMGTTSFALLAAGIPKLARLMSLELQWNEVDDEDDEGLQTLLDTFKLRGGKLYLNDEDEEDEVASDGDSGDDEVGEKDVITKKASDDLADLMSKVAIK
jgi:Ran GTPase-activating protein 1